MNFTKTSPEEAGWYLFRTGEGAGKVVVEVANRNGQFYVHGMRVVEAHGEWCRIYFQEDMDDAFNAGGAGASHPQPIPE